METRDKERVERIQQALKEAGWKAFICSLPMDVLMLSGYWPVVGNAIAVVTWEGRVSVLAPEDERDLVESGWADDVHTFQAGSLDAIEDLIEVVRRPLADLLNAAGLERGELGYEGGPASEPSSYAAMSYYGVTLPELIREVCPESTPVPADAALARLRCVKTPREVERIRKACRIAEQAYQAGARQMRAGQKETEVAALFRAPFSVSGVGFEGVGRADGFLYCMSGPNAAQAYAAYQRSRAKTLARGEFALVHCNSYADGYWTDITRTFCLGQPEERMQKMYEAVFAARKAALETIRPGARAADVDRAAREVMRNCGFGAAFKHPTGHGVGFTAIDHNAPPRLHPKSEEILETGMVFNVEPGLYFEDYGGLRHCDMVAVSANGMELLTPFLSDLPSLIL
ncbi:MAG TPA: Xaa-Pro peptidase family protein [Chthonomonadaceae bacterium]|nr:Xaa-Pro peptidase family protein [Chthonomonadaceae bacterium]